MAAGIGEVEASLIVEEGTELIVMLRDAEAFVEVHLKCWLHGLSVASHSKNICAS